MHLGQHHVGRAFGKEPPALDGRQLRRIAKDQHRLAEGQKIAAEFRIDHRTFVDDDEARFRNGAVFVENEGRLLRIGRPQPVDQAVDRARFLAALGTQNERGLAGESREGDTAIAILGDFLGERGLAGARIAEQPKQLRLAAFQPCRDGF